MQTLNKVLLGNVEVMLIDRFFKEDEAYQSIYVR